MKFIIGTCPKHCTTTYGTSSRGIEYWGGLFFSTSPVIHFTLREAELEAARLSTLEPDKAFVVFKAISFSEAIVNPVKLTKYD